MIKETAERVKQQFIQLLTQIIIRFSKEIS